LGLAFSMATSFWEIYPKEVKRFIYPELQLDKLERNLGVSNKEFKEKIIKARVKIIQKLYSDAIVKKSKKLKISLNFLGFSSLFSILDILIASFYADVACHAI
jgi:hypothetical protein